MSARRSPSTCTLGSQLVAISTVCSLIAPMLRTVSTPRPDITISRKVMTAAILIRMESFDMKMMSWLKIPGNVHAGRGRFGATRLSQAMPWGCAYDLRIEHPSELPVNEARVLLLTHASERGSTTPVGAFRAPPAVASCGSSLRSCLSHAAVTSTSSGAHRVQELADLELEAARIAQQSLRPLRLWGATKRHGANKKATPAPRPAPGCGTPAPWLHRAIPSAIPRQA